MRPTRFRNWQRPQTRPPRSHGPQGSSVRSRCRRGSCRRPRPFSRKRSQPSRGANRPSSNGASPPILRVSTSGNDAGEKPRRLGRGARLSSPSSPTRCQRVTSFVDRSWALVRCARWLDENGVAHSVKIAAGVDVPVLGDTRGVGRCTMVPPRVRETRTPSRSSGSTCPIPSSSRRTRTGGTSSASARTIRSTTGRSDRAWRAGGRSALALPSA